MKEQRHKRKESFSVLLVSNTDRSSRQFQISLLSIRLLIALPILLLVAVALLAWQYSMSYRSEEALRAQLASQEDLSAQLAQERAAWDTERQALAAENQELRQTVQEQAALQVEAPKEEEEVQEAEAPDSTVPTRYPYQGSGVLEGTYSEEHPFLSISTYAEGDIIATGDGTVTAVTSDDSYPHIIEVTHESGYTSRYLCRKEAEPKIEEGTAVEAGHVLIHITTDNTPLDYQIIYEEAPVDPLTLIDAKG
ncbi:MAG: M23 family metallopeptidase [Lachnospiraceae bacterium]|nr:M23 family metallopeptidase [Lachnospiraceae bacterium]